MILNSEALCLVFLSLSLHKPGSVCSVTGIVLPSIVKSPNKRDSVGRTRTLQGPRVLTRAVCFFLSQHHTLHCLHLIERIVSCWITWPLLKPSPWHCVGDEHGRQEAPDHSHWWGYCLFPWPTAHSTHVLYLWLPVSNYAVSSAWGHF
jgi:hypothetical protein